MTTDTLAIVGITLLVGFFPLFGLLVKLLFNMGELHADVKNAIKDIPELKHDMVNAKVDIAELQTLLPCKRRVP